MSKMEERYHRRRYQSSVATTIVSITLVLTMLGLLGLTILHARKLSDYVKENIGFRVYLKEDAATEDIIILQKKLDAEPFVKSSRYISPEEAARELTADLGEDFIDFLGYNPLPPSIDLRVRAAYANVESLETIERNLMQEVVVKEVFYQKSLVHLINKNVNRISIVLLGFTGLLMLIAIALINNTIRLSVYSKRFIIRTMKLVGATRRFISRPFIVRGVLQGFYSAIFAIILLVTILYFLMQQVPELVNLFDLYLYLAVFLLVMLTGMFLAWVSTWFAVRKYLRMTEDELYS
ncbi:MAG TPA: permease-like cell division protein FtsX [Bacteroidales bacterium]|nr:permease-like cell division protein FtsX [Bacteroidales bacterium]HOX77147.1 permease-like cell division protein FtsX [Bacteroidales bacterium]HPI85873.1 permease-like cell division protein FtsX [Bacteroidales bacterium]HPM91278.1 permease-like cell division protein FtsX [Bacteroidales bacterium]